MIVCCLSTVHFDDVIFLKTLFIIEITERDGVEANPLIGGQINSGTTNSFPIFLAGVGVGLDCDEDPPALGYQDWSLKIVDGQAVAIANLDVTHYQRTVALLRMLFKAH